MDVPALNASAPDSISAGGRAFGSADGGACPEKSFFGDVEIVLPEDLACFGSTVRAAALGNRGGPAIVVLGGISGNRFPCRTKEGSQGWWPGLAGPGRAIDPARHLIIGVDFAADPTGASAPSTADQARVLAAALDGLAVHRVHALVGASYGGMVGLAFAELYPERVGRLVVISAGAEPHACATAARELQRRVVGLGIASGQSEEALAIARGMAMLTYRTSEEFGQRFSGGIDERCPLSASQPGEYLRARGQHFLTVMSPERFLSLSASIDRHSVDPARVHCPLLAIGAESDQLVPHDQLRSLVARYAGPAQLHLRRSLYGHDMFLKEAEALGALIAPFLEGPSA